MKSKKLFAILTLVCFMFTLMPVAAFAAVDEIVDDQIYVADEAVTAENADVELTIGDQSEDVFFAAVGKSDAVTTSNYAFYVVDEDGEYVAVSKDGSFPTALRVAGDYKVYAINVAGADSEALDDVFASIALVAEKVEALLAWAGAQRVLNDYATVTVEASKYAYKIVLDGYDKDDDYVDFVEDGEDENEFVLSINGDSGFSKDGKVVAQLQRALLDEEGEPGEFTNFKRAGLELSISKAGYINVDAASLKTDSKGQVVFEVTSNYTNDNNKVIVKYGKAKAELTVNVVEINVANVVVNAEPAAPVNNEDSIQKAGIEFKFTDVNGVAVNNVGTAKIFVVEKPANSKMKTDDFTLVADDEGKTGVFDLASDEYVVEDSVVTDGTFDKDGKYVIKVALQNGSSAEATVTVAEMGDVVAIKFHKAPVTVAYGAGTQVATVIAVDANGVTTDISDDVELSASGLAVDAFYAANATVGETTIEKGTLKAKNDDKYIGAKITVLAVYDEFTATTELTVVDQAATIKYLSTTAEVSLTATLTGMIMDAEGKVSSIGADEEVKVIVLDKPENAVVVAAAQDTLNAKKQVVTTFLANTPGEYKIQTIITYTEGGAVKYISGIETITVGGGVNTFKDVVVVSLGADKMIVNNDVVALDVAPFIENSRTMMQFNVLYVFGIDVQWVKETESIVAEGNGLKVVMQLGSKVATVNGEEVALDVAPYSVNGRTVVPVGFITGLLDITPTFTYNADGTIADILFTK